VVEKRSRSSIGPSRSCAPTRRVAHPAGKAPENILDNETILAVYYSCRPSTSQLVGRDAGSNSSAGCKRGATISRDQGLLCSSSSERPRPCTLPRVGRGQVHRLLSIVFLVQRALQLASRGAIRLRHPCLPVRSGRCLGDLREPAGFGPALRRRGKRVSGARQKRG
jgi:hypothetical protein